MQCECTVLCENSVAGSLGFIGEHGWAVHVRVNDTNILFDTGQGLGLLHNSTLLDIDLREIDAVVLSHGHYDHTTGLPDLLQLTGPKTVFLHPDSFVSRYWLKDGESREIGIRYRQEYLASLGAEFTPVESFTELFPDVYVTGEVPRVTPFEKPDPFMKLPLPEGNWQQDMLRDDMSLIIRTPKGLIIILGCAHAGLINILHHVRENLPQEQIHAVFGGTHLGFADPKQFNATVEALNQFDIQHIGTAHCTGLENAARLHAIFKERFFFSAVGTRFTCQS